MPLLAVTAYEAGQVTCAITSLGIGLVLVALGLRRRRRVAAPAWSYGAPVAGATGHIGGTAAETGDASWTRLSEPVAPTEWMPTEPATSRGIGLIVGGTILTVLTLLGGAILLADRGAGQRRVVLPTAVLGLARDAGASAQVGKQALASLPAGLTDPQAAVYGPLPHAVIVIAANARTTRPVGQLERFRRGIEQSGGTMRRGRDVDAGRLGGAGRCWEAALSGARPEVCVFVDRGSLVATIDFLGGGLDAAAKRGRQVREATVSRK